MLESLQTSLFVVEDSANVVEKFLLYSLYSPYVLINNNN